MNKRRGKDTKAIEARQAHKAVLGVIGGHIQFGIKGRKLDDKRVWEILVYACVNQMSIESACRELAQAPSGNRVREHLGEALDNEREAVVKLEEQLNASLWGGLPRWVRRGLNKGCFEIAIDLHDIPYHGQPALNPEEIRHGPARSGTTHFHSYATLAIVHNQCRYQLAVTLVWADESMAEVVQRLIEPAKSLIQPGKPLKLRFYRAYLDKGFCSREVFGVLRAKRLPYLIPIPLKGKKDEQGVYQGGIGRLFKGNKSFYTQYTFNAKTTHAYTTDVAIVRTYTAGRYGRRGVAWFAYAVYKMSHIPPNQIFTLYRRRFGIESGYRQLGQVRARTASTSPALRLLLVGLALILLNLYFSLRQAWFTVHRYGSRVHFASLTLHRFALYLSRFIEQLFGINPLHHSLSKPPLDLDFVIY